MPKHSRTGATRTRAQSPAAARVGGMGEDVRVLNRLGFPQVGEHRRFVSAIVADTVGSGLFMPITL